MKGSKICKFNYLLNYKRLPTYTAFSDNKVRKIFELTEDLQSLSFLLTAPERTPETTGCDIFGLVSSFSAPSLHLAKDANLFLTY